MDIQARKPINRDSKTPTRSTSANAVQRQQDEMETSNIYTEEEEQCTTQDDSELLQDNVDLEESQDSYTNKPPESPKRVKNSSVNYVPNVNFTPESAIGSSSSSYGLILVFIILTVGAVAFGYLLNNTSTPLPPPHELRCRFDKLQRLYPKQEAVVWNTLSAGIEHILNKRSRMPGVYLFVHEGVENVHSLVRKIASASSQCFGNEKRDPVEMQAEDFSSADAIADYGHTIEKYKRKMKDGQHVILIANLNKIPAEAARALHSICDTHNPIFEDVIIFLTLFTAESQGNAVERAVETLFDLWGSSLGRHELDPLITRVTDQVIPLQS